MNRQEQTEIINDLAAFVKNHREDQFGDHESLYMEMLKQWRQLSRPNMKGATPENQDLYDRYWDAMGKWHQRFVKEQDRIVDPEPFAPDPYGESPLQDNYVDLIEDLSAEIIADLPRPAAADVIAINDFGRLLNIQLLEMRELYTDVLNPIDFILLMEYWQMVDQVVQGREVEG
ncbi:MAG: hypothetical protein PUF79_05835 [Lactobacillaceae bacterium]|nr:hypothetical protein [Lactobacillaceae bacterium]